MKAAMIARIVLFVALSLAFLPQAYSEAKCVEIEFKPTKGHCKDKSYKTKRCMSSTIDVGALSATNMYTTAHQTVIMNVETINFLNVQAETGRQDTDEMDEDFCVKTLKFQYDTEKNAKETQCEAQPSSSLSGIEWTSVPLGGTSKPPKYDAPSSCDCKDLTKYFVDLNRFRAPQAYTRQAWWFGNECDYDQQCAVALVNGVEQPYDRICCDSFKKVADSYCKDYQESTLTLLTNLLKVQTADWWKCFDEQCIKASGASSTLPFVLLSASSAFLTLLSI